MVSGSIEQTRVSQTMAAIEAQVDSESSVNEQILLTVAAGSTPTPPLVAGQAPANNVASLDADGGAQENMDFMLATGRFFLLTGVTENVDPTTDCAVNAANNFDRPVERLYATLQAINIESGTLLSAEWTANGELVVRDDWIVPFDSNDACLWFSIDGSDTDFPAGSWTVTLFADEFRSQIQSPIAFTISGD